MIRLGAPVFIDTDDPYDFARAHIAEGYTAALCPPWVHAGESANINYIREAMEIYEIVIAEVWAWSNVMAADEKVANAAIEYNIERLTLADELGAKCCVNLIGNWKTPMGGHDEKNFSEYFFARSVDVARTIIDAVKPKRTKMVFEIMPFNFLDCYENYIRYLKMVDRKEAELHLDPINCINNVKDLLLNASFLPKVVDKFGPKVVSYHLKDIKLRDNTNMPIMEEVIPGRGMINYQNLLAAIDWQGGERYCIIEHLDNNEQYREAAGYVRRCASAVGVEIMNPVVM